MECIETNIVCSNTNKKCKICKLDDCKKVIKILEMQEKYIRKQKLDKIKSQLPKQCKNCSYLEIIDLDNMKVKCFYLLNNKCVLRRKDN